MLVTSLYSDINELYLDFSIYGEIVSAPQQSLKELRDMYFSEFSKIKPMPSLESKRYELSNPVSDDYAIDSFDTPLLNENEKLIDLTGAISENKIRKPDSVVIIADNIRDLFTIENAVKNSKRDNILSKYNIETGDILSDVESSALEQIQGTVVEDKSTYLSEEEVDKLLLPSSQSSEPVLMGYKKDIDIEGIVDKLGLENFDDSESSSQAALDFIKEMKNPNGVSTLEQEVIEKAEYNEEIDANEAEETDYDDVDYAEEDEEEADYDDVNYTDEDEEEVDYDEVSYDDDEEDSDYDDVGYYDDEDGIDSSDDEDDTDYEPDYSDDEDATDYEPELSLIHI